MSLLRAVCGDATTALTGYRVQVTLQPPAAHGTRDLAAQAITGVVGSTVCRARAKDRMTVAYEREHPVPADVAWSRSTWAP